MNRAALDALPLLPFFLPASGGQRYCLLHLPPPGQAARGGILYVHPFAEELNKSRHVAAAQARAFAAAGYSVLQIDLFGCGDSSGDFGEARWDIWHNDLHLACAWMAQRVDGPLTVWGLRLGALLALDFASRPPLPLARLLLWQPELDGRRSIDRFLRLRLATRMLAGTTQEAPGQARAALANGEAVEVAGYLLAPELAQAIDDVSVAALLPAMPVYWLDYHAADQTGPWSPPLLARQWRERGAAVHVASFDDGPFWHSGELLACPQLLYATRKLCRDWLDEERPPP
ncbi:MULTISPECIES: hydrolase 2, exosortase A system-associated [Janthinobacterium]|jgi:exosortase A-associated hydrolase 2|uniref:Hydrolase 2, exosortase A system-associated n=1 Tax=Janthinobacterium lividum TaxID=29581 RepID=A0ABU0XQX4_9BURK|nr:MULTISPECIES: hydrolase 2, exosortase A system-associated [Janthinobacterium]MBR7634385.1 hydrolase 2, exosortase A system-associated [Janthinobacterium lividum]MCC7697572.1 hydrolase 2, exosortase A system-associated [Janthinobacterium sp. EB271-G4-7A]MCC7713275.1 hydrolase 2, exosortase A system-associated [Janthinobacterium lividum]MDO8033084.1 hydrolase 2, exosortase A system-associated [Janthinobacterium sp. SUN128]MDQ4624551.1 hydrolase 2, exosortase A system-associated [Janthinobacte